MLHPDLATNPYALTAIVCAATFMVAPITLTVYKYAAFLTLITFHSLILCQYKCGPASCQPIVVMHCKSALSDVRMLHLASFESEHHPGLTRSAAVAARLSHLPVNLPLHCQAGCLT